MLSSFRKFNAHIHAHLHSYRQNRNFKIGFCLFVVKLNMVYSLSNGGGVIFSVVVVVVDSVVVVPPHPGTL